MRGFVSTKRAKTDLVSGKWTLSCACLAMLLAVTLTPPPCQAADQEQGAFYNADGGVTFRVFSSRATRVAVCIYDQPLGHDEKLCVVLEHDAGSRIWWKTVSKAELAAARIDDALLYGYRAWGPNWPFVATWKPGSENGFIADVDDEGNRFNPNKLLLDPYAREVSHDPRTPSHPDVSIYQSGPARRAVDTGRLASKGVVLQKDGESFGDRPLRTLQDDVIYEVHLRGLTKGDPGVPPALQGTYAGAALKAPALKALGVSAVEFLPIFEFQNDANDRDPFSAEGDNYWGYDPLNFFAPDRRYAANKSWGGPTREFKAMVRAFHKHGIKVLLDVVYNHTGEGNVDGDSGETGAIYSWRGLDSPAYYELRDDNGPYQPGGRPTRFQRNGYYSNNNGVGPNVNATDEAARRLVLRSLAYWAHEMGVDGFRFDLAAVLGNRHNHAGFEFDRDDPENILNRAAADLPARNLDGTGYDLIAEPYAIGDGAYQQGNFPAGWAEWNDQFRYPMRRKQNKLGIAGQEVAPAQLISFFAGSSQIMNNRGRKPYHGVNFIVAHDGFTLRDLYSYREKKNNQPYPLGPSDGGTDENYSWDQDGDTAKQRAAARTGMALLLLSAGTPMLVGGDEMYRTQFGNNNPFNLDNSSFYLDYGLRDQFPEFFAYAKGLIQFREAHTALRRAEFFNGRDHNGNGVKDVTWLRDNGKEADAAYLDNSNHHFIAFRLDGTEVGDQSDSLLVAFNAFTADIPFTLPRPLNNHRWYLIADSSAGEEARGHVRAAPEAVSGDRYNVASRSIAVFIEDNQ